MKSLFLIRHGKASLEGDEKDRGLTPEGETQANQLSALLLLLKPKIGEIYSSPYRRAILTAEPFSKSTEINIQIVEDLREKTMSTEPIEDLNNERRKMWDDFSCRLPGGETSQEVQDRAMVALQGIVQGMSSEGAACFSHGNLIGHVLKKVIPDFGFDDWRSMGMPDIYRLDYSDVSSDPTVTHVNCEGVDTFKISVNK